MEDVPPAIARAIVLRHLPRPLRAGLDPRAGEGVLPAELAADAEAISGGLGAELAAWIRVHVGETAGLSRWPADDAPGAGVAISAAGGIDALDRAVAIRDDPDLREIGDALLLLGRADGLVTFAGRAAVAAWSYLDRLPEAGAILHQLALASKAAQDDFEAADVAWPDLGAEGGSRVLPDAAVDAAVTAWRAAIDGAFAELRIEARLLAIGLSAVAAGRALPAWQLDSLGQVALGIGRAVVEPLTLAATREGHRQGEDYAQTMIQVLRNRIREHEAAASPSEVKAEAEVAVPDGHVLVCPGLQRTGASKGKEIARGYEHAIGTALPLVPTPDLGGARRKLLEEFPYATGAVDAALGAFSGRPHVHAPPLLVVGPPGAGKSRFVRRLGEALGVGVYRVDGANDGGASFGGTERRWYSSEPCRPFMAVARHVQANPIVLVDEVDKAATRSEYGRLWDSMLQALDPENAARFPDPSLQVELDISWVTVICTANTPSPLPMPLLDRMRIVRFPEPGPEHLEALLPAVLAGIATEAGMDPRFVSPLDSVERAALRSRWRGGSVRRLRRAVEAILRVRDRALAGRPQ